MLSAVLAPLLTAACAGEPFGFAADRCQGAHNQCQTDCTGLDDGPARGACIQRCYDRETQCYASGYEGSSIAVDRAAGAARSQAEKEADFQRWKAERERESAEKSSQETQQPVKEPETEPQS